MVGAVELTNLPVFNMMRRRLEWLTQRQQVVARNLANANTPGYRARDLKPLDFRRDLQNSLGLKLPVSAPNAKHIVSSVAPTQFRQFEERRPSETTPDGNAVILEEQLGLNNEIVIQHSLITRIYGKHLQMLKSALRSR